jgi:hypothetical protein
MVLKESGAARLEPRCSAFGIDRGAKANRARTAKLEEKRGATPQN